MIGADRSPVDFDVEKPEQPGAGSGEVAVNGAAARLVQVGDTIIVLAYTEMDDAEARALQPRVVLVDAQNRPLTVPAAAEASGPR